MNKNEIGVNVFPQPKETFIANMKEKQYFIKISSRDTHDKTPFDIHVKFAMDIGYGKLSENKNKNKTDNNKNKPKNLTDEILTIDGQLEQTINNLYDFDFNQPYNSLNNEYQIGKFNKTPAENKFDFNIFYNTSYNSVYNDASKRYEAIVYNKFNEINYIEVTEILIPRFIPSNIIGNFFDGFILIKSLLPTYIITTYSESITKELTNYLISAYPGSIIQTGTVIINGKSVNYIRITNNKESIILLPIGYLENTTLLCGICVFKDARLFDHININNNIYPIMLINNNNIFINNFSPLTPNILPATSPLILPYGNILFNSSDLTFTHTTLTIPNMSITLIENIYEDNVLRIVDASNNNYYFIITSYREIITKESDIIKSSVIEFTGIWTDIPLALIGNCFIYLFGFGSRDLLNERIFYLELESFRPTKSTATNRQIDKMFGIFFPSSQSKDWLYLSGEAQEAFLPLDTRKFDKLVIRLYDSNGLPLDNVFKKRLSLLNYSYNRNMYTNVIIKISEIEKNLEVVKSIYR